MDKEDLEAEIVVPVKKVKSKPLSKSNSAGVTPKRSKHKIAYTTEAGGDPFGKSILSKKEPSPDILISMPQDYQNKEQLSQLKKKKKKCYHYEPWQIKPR